MKKLNRKGFTLVELLAVIIILAIVVGITIPAILTTTSKAKVKAFDTAVETIRTYIENQVQMSTLSSDLQPDEYDATIGGCTKNTAEDPCTSATLLTKTGYSDNIGEIKWYVSNYKVTITCATAQGDYTQSTTYPACDR